MAESICGFINEKLHCCAKGVDSLSDALEAGDRDHYDFLFYDCTLTGCFGIRGFQHLTSKFPDTAVVLFSHSVDHQFLASALDLGLRGYLPKSMPLKSLVPTIELLKSGEVFVPAQTMAQILKGSAEDRVSDTLLTSKEVNLLCLIEDGLSNKQIGGKMGVTENTVKMKLRTLYQKIGANNRMAALKIAKDLGEF